jgi:hypothetical protein
MNTSWSELSRFVADAERFPWLQQSFKNRHSKEELLLTASSFGYRIICVDLQLAEEEDKQEQQGTALITGRR